MKLFSNLALTCTSIAVVASSITAAATGPEATKKGYAHVRTLVPAIIGEYKQQAILTDAQKSSKYRVFESQFIDPSEDKTCYSRITHAMELAEKFWGERRSWHFRALDDTLSINAANKNKINQLVNYASYRSKTVKDLIEFSKGSNVTLSPDFNREGLEAVYAYMSAVNEVSIDPLAKEFSPQVLAQRISHAMSDGYVVADEVVRPKNQAAVHKLIDRTEGNTYIVDVFKYDDLGRKYLAKEFRYKVPASYKDVYLYTDGFVSGYFKSAGKSTKAANGGNTTEVFSYNVVAEYATEHRKWQKQIPYMQKFSDLTRGAKDTTTTECLSYVDRMLKEIGAPTRAATKATPFVEPDTAALNAAWRNLVAVAEKHEVIGTYAYNARKKRDAAIEAQLKKSGGKVRPPKGDLISTRITFRKPSGSSYSTKYFAGGRAMLHPEGKPEACYMDLELKYANVYVSQFPVNQPQVLTIINPDGEKIWDTTLTVGPRDESVYVSIDEKLVLGDGSNEQLSLEVRFMNEKGNSIKSADVKGFKVAVAKKKSPEKKYITKELRSYYITLMDVFCSDQIISLIDPSGAIVWSQEVFVDVANKTKGKQEAKLTVSQAVFTGGASEPATKPAAKAEESSAPVKKEKKKSRGSKLKSLGKKFL